MDHPVIDLMHQCVVRLALPGGKVGSGFFVAPERIVTCAHVVGDLKTGKYYDGAIQVRWQEREDFAEAKVLPAKWLPDVDIALLHYSARHPNAPPCVLLGQVCQTGDDLVSFGYPYKDFPNGDSAAFECKGYTGDNSPLVRFKLDNIQRGMSGAPVLNLRTKRVCAMVKFTVDTRSISGGGGVPVTTILERFHELTALQAQHHRQDPRWYAHIGVKTPGDLVDLVKNNIAEKLSKPRLETLREYLSSALKTMSGIIARSPSEIASRLVEMDSDPIFTLLLSARRDAVDSMRDQGRTERDMDDVRTGTLDILGWRVLLTVNRTWLAQNRDALYPQAFPGAIALPVRTETGIEIIHAAIQERSACFRSAEGKLAGAERMPAMEHEFLEEGFDAEDIVRSIKTAIYLHINRKRGLRDLVPEEFTSEVDKRFNAKLKMYNALDKNVYLVVNRTKKSCPMDDGIYKQLKSDLPDLQVIFHESDQTGKAFNVDEIELDSTLDFFFDRDKES